MSEVKRIDRRKFLKGAVGSARGWACSTSFLPPLSGATSGPLPATAS